MSDERSTPEIGILLGSKSDLALVKKVEDVFSYFGVTWEISVASAHRTPEMYELRTKPMINPNDGLMK